MFLVPALAMIAWFSGYRWSAPLIGVAKRAGAAAAGSHGAHRGRHRPAHVAAAVAAAQPAGAGNDAEHAADVPGDRL
ncbi:hypothetical protein LP419_31485 [Massilia sp. H-1]|nr:hypothetical protein LP419_31485 [Massilia sp. H-1]